MAHTLTAKLSDAREIFMRDRQGDLIEGDRASEHIACVNCDLAGNGIRVGMLLRVTAPKEFVPDTNDIGDLFAWNAGAVLPAYLGSKKPINIFREQGVRLTDFLEKMQAQEGDRYSYMGEIGVAIDDQSWDSLKLQVEEYTAARTSFDLAVERLQEHADLWPDGLRAEASEVSYLLDYLDDCLSSASLGFMYCWYQEKQARIRSTFSDLMRRKRSSHAGYQREKEFIRGTLFSYSAPEYWIDNPPASLVSA